MNLIVFQVECFDYNRSGNHSLIGEFYVTVRQLQMGPGEQNVYEAINPKKKLVRKMHNSDSLVCSLSGHPLSTSTNFLWILDTPLPFGHISSTDAFGLTK